MKKFFSFLMCVLFTMVFNLELAAVGAVLLALHFIINISVLWAVGALAAWVLISVIKVAFIGWASGCSSESDPPKRNVNPYSAATAQYLNRSRTADRDNSPEKTNSADRDSFPDRTNSSDSDNSASKADTDGDTSRNNAV